MEAPPVTPPKKHKYVLPFIILVILCGMASPLVLSAWKHRELTSNETATLALIREYTKAQDERFKSRGAYATNLDELALSAKLPPLDNPKSTPLNGYRFRILTDSIEGSWLDADGKLTKSFGLLAVPSDYMVTGRDTFLVHGQEIFVVDFEVRTAQLTRELRAFGLPPSAQKVE